MSTHYTLTVKNNSLLSGDICVYQTNPNGSDNNLHTLAWFSKKCHPHTEIMFEWDLEYSFTWCETGVLTPGVRFYASQIEPADPTNTSQNAIGFTLQDGAYTFTSTSKRPSAGSLGIYTDGTVPNNQASIGIGIGGKSAFAANATPNYNFTFIPHPQYWIAFGNFTAGEVIDLNQVTNSAQIVFPVNIYSKEVTLKEDNTWEVNSLKLVNDTIRKNAK